MEDDELAALRQQRLAQLQQQHGQAESGGDASGQQQKQRQEQQKERDDEMRNSILSQVLTQEARGRLSTLGAVKPERARMVENIIIQNARMGSIRGKVGEEQLKELLEKVTEQTKRETKVSYERRRVFDEDSDDDE